MRWLLALLLLPGCPLCDLDLELDVVHGSSVLRPGDTVGLSLDSAGSHAGPDRCRGIWYVNEIAWGNDELGRITNCGEYTAPFWPRPRPYKVEIWGTHYGVDGCADCCPFQAIKLTVID